MKRRLVSTQLLFAVLPLVLFSTTFADDSIECLRKTLRAAENRFALRKREATERAPFSKLVFKDPETRELRRLKLLEEERDPTVSVFSSVPEDDCDFRAVFDRDPTAGESKGLDKLVKSAEGLGKRLKSNAEFEKLVSETKSTFVLSVGHNERGWFLMPDASFLSLQEMSDICYKHGKVPIFVSCEAKSKIEGGGIGATTRLTYDEAFSIAKRVQGVLGAQKGRKIKPSEVAQQIQAVISKEEKINKARYRAKIVISASGSVVGIGILSALPDDDKESRKRLKPEKSPAKKGQETKE